MFVFSKIRCLVPAAWVALVACGSDDSVQTPPNDASVDVDASVWMEEPIDINELPTSVPTLSITLSETDIARLNLDPYGADDVIGEFRDEQGNVYDNVEINFRGAYALRGLIRKGDRRNWKVKFSKEAPYLNRREWNFNYEPHIKQKLAYDLMRFAGVRCAKPQHVLLSVNGEAQGLYLQYEDLDNSEWLKDNFSNHQGDLYKAGYDLPDDVEGRRFAELTYLGERNDNYFRSYNKKKTRDGVAKTDNSSIREFTEQLNAVADSEIPQFYEDNVVIDKVISYLVVASFMSHWDAYPYRPKNYWLYQNPDDNRWSMLPWDMDGAFEDWALGIPNWGIEASIFFQYDQYDTYDHLEDEGTGRPFVRRMMKHDTFRQAYLARYRELMGTIFADDFLDDRIQAITDLIDSVASDEDKLTFSEDNDDVIQFLDDRRANVNAQLSNL